MLIHVQTHVHVQGITSTYMCTYVSCPDIHTHPWISPPASEWGTIQKSELSPRTPFLVSCQAVKGSAEELMLALQGRPGALPPAPCPEQHQVYGCSATPPLGWERASMGPVEAKAQHPATVPQSLKPAWCLGCNRVLPTRASGALRTIKTP